MTLLEIVQDVSDVLGLPRPESVVNNTANDVRQMLANANKVGDKLITDYNWPQLNKEHTFTTVSGTASYALPADFQKFLLNTAYDRTNKWIMLGGVTPQQWQFRKSGLIQSSIYKQYRIKGNSSNQFFIDSTPTAADNLVFEYQSTNWILPIVWTTGYTFAANAYCSYNGNIYKTSSAGVSGATPPTHTTGSASDGTITWVFQSIKYNKFLADTDFPVIDDELVKDFLAWYFLRSKGLEYGEYKQTALTNASNKYAQYRASQTFNLNPYKTVVTFNDRIPDKISGV